ncbi:MAG TPA: hypothetical protein VGJ48_15290 [Pyrinomonadaceae bacterium]|jgi:hypothetical protein
MKNEIWKICSCLPEADANSDGQAGSLSYFVATTRAVMYHPSLPYVLNSPEIHQ